MLAAASFLTVSIALGGVLYGGGVLDSELRSPPAHAGRNNANPPNAASSAGSPPHAGGGGAVAEVAAAASADRNDDTHTLSGFVPVPQMSKPLFITRTGGGGISSLPPPSERETEARRGSGSSDNSDRGRRELGGSDSEDTGIPPFGAESVVAGDALPTVGKETAMTAATSVAAERLARVATAGAAVEVVKGAVGTDSSSESGGNGGGGDGSRGGIGGGSSGSESRDGHLTTLADGNKRHRRHSTPLATMTATVPETLTDRKVGEGVGGDGRGDGGDGDDSGGGGGRVGRSPLVVSHEMLYSSAVEVDEEDLVDDIDEDVFEDVFDDAFDGIVFDGGDQEASPSLLPPLSPRQRERRRERRRLMAAATAVAKEAQERDGYDADFVEDDADMYHLYFQSHRVLPTVSESESERVAAAAAAHEEGTKVLVPSLPFEHRLSGGGVGEVVPVEMENVQQISVGELNSPLPVPLLVPASPPTASSVTLVSGHDPERNGEGAGKGKCSPLEVVGLSDCPELEGSLDKILAAKADMLRQVIAVLSDPASAGEGGNPDEPLLLVQKLALDEADAMFGAFDSKFIGRATDAGRWSPLPGGFNRWAERYHKKVLKKSRPVLVAVHVSVMMLALFDGWDLGFCFGVWFLLMFLFGFGFGFGFGFIP